MKHHDVLQRHGYSHISGKHWERRRRGPVHMLIDNLTVYVEQNSAVLLTAVSPERVAEVQQALADTVDPVHLEPAHIGGNAWLTLSFTLEALPQVMQVIDQALATRTA